MHSEISLGVNINNGVENPEHHEEDGIVISENNQQQQISESDEQIRGEREINEEEQSEKTKANVDVEAKPEEEEDEKKDDEEEYYDDIWDDYEYDYLEEETEPQVTKRPTVDFARLKFRSLIQNPS